MSVDKIQKLEKSDKFKKKLYAKGVWKNYAIVPPSGIIFVALFAFLYLFNSDRLISLYTIPFVILMLLGTIWLKATRKYLIDKKIEKSEGLKICLSIPLVKMNGKTIRIFSVGKNRHNKYYLEKEKREILDKIDEGFFDKSLFTSKKSLILIPETDIYVIIPLFSDRISNKNKTSTVNSYVAFDNKKVMRTITHRELEGFS